ncbi:MAG: hypothetical protein KAR45_00715 [Desulfobacteraceae bacterium]|nr:hypothetical protein [Desulfobacteraceae bacterium]
MADKKKNIKTIVLILISMFFLFMIYNTFFKTKKSPGRPALKTQPQKVINILPENIPIPQQAGAAAQVPGSDTGKTVETRVQPFEYTITHIFEPSDIIKTARKKKSESLKMISDAIKMVVKPKNAPAMSEQEKISFKQALEFKGSILSNTGAVAIINREFIHVGDKINGYKVTSISEKQVNIDTGRGMITLEIMKNE